jgi:hypothetical protein
MLDPYKGIDDQVYLKAAQRQYGSDTTLWPNAGHAYQWHAKRPANEQRYPINLQGYSDSLYSQNWRITMAEGVDKYAWRWLNTFSLDWAVLPVMFVAADVIWEVQAVKDAAARWARNLEWTSDWYASKLEGKRFRVCKPQVISDRGTAADIQKLYLSSMAPDKRFLPWETCHKNYNSAMAGRVNANLIYAITHYAGPQADWDYAAAGGGPYLFVSSFATLHDLSNFYTLTDPTKQTLAYAIAHEIGHCFGLGHTESQLAADWQQSIMQASRPPAAILADYERKRLLNNPFFS